MVRLIDADALIKDLKYDVELDARALDDTDLSLGINRELVQFDKDCKQNAIDMLKKAPTVDAVPVEWIEVDIEASAFSGYDMHSYEVATMLEEWKEKERKDDEQTANKGC